MNVVIFKKIHVGHWTQNAKKINNAFFSLCIYKALKFIKYAGGFALNVLPAVVVARCSTEQNSSESSQGKFLKLFGNSPYWIRGSTEQSEAGTSRHESGQAQFVAFCLQNKRGNF